MFTLCQLVACSASWHMVDFNFVYNEQKALELKVWAAPQLETSSPRSHHRSVWSNIVQHSFFLFVCFVLFCFVFWDRVSLCSSCCPGTHFVDQAGLELRNLPASASWVLWLKVCATTPSPKDFYSHYVSTLSLSRHTRRGHPIPLQMVVSHHMVAGNCTQDLWRADNALNSWAISPAPDL